MGIREKYDYGKLEAKIMDSYKKVTGTNGKPQKSFETLMECIDDAFMDEYVKMTSDIGRDIFEQAQLVQAKATETLSKLDAEVTEWNEQVNEVHDERVADALKAYQTIVNMNFSTPQQKLQNIQNASYFIWALYAKESSTASMFLKTVSDVENEPKVNAEAERSARKRI